MNRTLLLLLLLCPVLVYGVADYQFQVGPEFYHLKREREKGTRQHGFLYGARTRLDRITPNAWYWGLEGAWAEGKLKGHSGAGNKLHSKLMDALVEIRFGYTWQTFTATCASITPFLGWGHCWEKNNYLRPSPVKLHFRNTYDYLALGGLGQLYINPQWTFGIQVTARFCYSGKVRVTRDPEVKKTVILRFEDKVNCRVCLPFTYIIGWSEGRQRICLNPFFEYRHFGKFSRVPFDFLDTRLKVYGADLYWTYVF